MEADSLLESMRNYSGKGSGFIKLLGGVLGGVRHLTNRDGKSPGWPKPSITRVAMRAKRMRSGGGKWPRPRNTTGSGRHRRGAGSV